jgi:hypothetical protein
MAVIGLDTAALVTLCRVSQNADTAQSELDLIVMLGITFLTCFIALDQDQGRACDSSGPRRAAGSCCSLLLDTKPAFDSQIRSQPY